MALVCSSVLAAPFFAKPRSLVLSCDSKGLGERGDAGRPGGHTHRRIPEGGTVVPDSGSGRAGRREMGVPDPARRVQRPVPFRGIPGGARIARNILSDRLGKMVAGGILERTPDPSDRRKVIYSLTEKGEALMPVVLALRQWGEQWGHGRPGSCWPTAATASPMRTMGPGARRPRAQARRTDLDRGLAGTGARKPPSRGRASE